MNSSLHTNMTQGTVCDWDLTPNPQYRLSIGRRLGCCVVRALNHVATNSLAMLFVVLCLNASQDFASTDVVDIEGQVEAEYVADPNHPQIESNYRFRVQLSPNKEQWRIDNLSDPPGSAFLLKGWVLERQVFASASAPSQFRLAALLDGYPIDLSYPYRMIWFVYCATDYLRAHEGQAVILPRGDPRIDLITHSSRMTSTWESQMDICPRTVRFLADRGLLQAGVAQLTLEPPGRFLEGRGTAVNDLLTHTTNGTQTASFQAGNWIALAGIRVPGVWTFTMLSNGKAIRIYRGTTDSARVIGSIDSESLTGVVQMVDLRVRNAQLGVNSVRYAVTNGAIPDLDSGELQALVARTAWPALKRMPPDLRSTRLLFIGLLAILFVAPVLIRLVAIYKRSHGVK